MEPEGSSPCSQQPGIISQQIQSTRYSTFLYNQFWHYPPAHG